MKDVFHVYNLFGDFIDAYAKKQVNSYSLYEFISSRSTEQKIEKCPLFKKNIEEIKNFTNHSPLAKECTEDIEYHSYNNCFFDHIIFSLYTFLRMCWSIVTCERLRILSIIKHF